MHTNLVCINYNKYIKVIFPMSNKIIMNTKILKKCYYKESKFLFYKFPNYI